jgi:hypothetical protein
MNGGNVIEGCAADPTFWVVEWSSEQRCMHITQLGAFLEMNREIALRRMLRSPGYIPLAIFATEDEAEDFASAFEPRLVVATQIVSRGEN